MTDYTTGFDTIAIRSGHRRTAELEHSEAIFATSSFVFENAAQVAARFSGDEPGNIYSRFTNPTTRAFEERLAAMEFKADRSARLQKALANLDDRERRIIEKRHLSDEPAQLQDLGAEMGISKQRVYQLEHRAIEKLRSILEDLEAA